MPLPWRLQRTCWFRVEACSWIRHAGIKNCSIPADKSLTANGVRYAFIELWVQDWSAVLARLDARSPRLSQVASTTAPAPGTEWEFGTAEETLAIWQTQLVRPAHDWLRLSAESAADQNLSEALRFLGPHE